MCGHQGLLRLNRFFGLAFALVLITLLGLLQAYSLSVEVRFVSTDPGPIPWASAYMFSLEGPAPTFFCWSPGVSCALNVSDEFSLRGAWAVHATGSFHYGTDDQTVTLHCNPANLESTRFVCDPVGPLTFYMPSYFGNIEGTVRDANGQPVQWAVVSATVLNPPYPFGPGPAITDADGFYRFRPFDPTLPMYADGILVPPGGTYDYEVQVSLPGTGGVAAAQRVTVRGGEITRADFVIGPPELPRSVQTAEGPPSPTCPEACLSYVGGPVNVTTGNMYTQQEDLAYPSAFGRFSFTRTYNSQSTYQGPLGLGWTHPFDFELKEVQPGVIRVRNGAGNVRFYEPISGSPDTYAPAAPARDTSTLVKHDGGFTETERSGLRREFDASGRLSAIITRTGWTTTLTYSPDGLATVTDPGGRTLTFSYSSGQLARVEGPGGLFAAYSYDPQGRLTIASDALGTHWTYTYNDASPSRLTSVVDANGHLVEQHTYDDAGRVIATAEADGVRALTLAYQDSSDTQVTDSLGRVTTYTFGVFGDLPLVTQIQGPCACGSPDSTFQYDAQGRRIAVTDARGYTTAFQYDADGNLTQVTDALGHVTTSTYNSFGQVLATTDPTGATTAFAYDEITGFLRQVTDALGHTTILSPDPHNLPGALTDPRSHTTTFTYADTGLLSSVTDSTGARTTFTYDPAGRLLSTTDAAGGSTRYTYDGRGRLLTTTDPIGAVAHFQYDPAGNRTGLTDPNGRSTTYIYDAANRLTQITDPAAGITAYAYDTEKNLLSVTDAKRQTTAFAYDDRNRVVKRTDPLGASESFTYDAVGNLTTRTDRKGQTLSFAYDVLNRLTVKTLPDSASVSYAYDPLGRLLGATDLNGTLSFTYDALGRALSTSSQDSRTLHATYDPAGNRIGLQDETGHVTTYAYDARNLLTGITDPRTGTFGFGYDALGRRTALTLPNGIGTTYAYDLASRLTALTHSGHWGPFEALGYAYDPTGNRVTDTRNHRTHQYAYDPLDQLTQVQAGDPHHHGKVEEAYTYDPVGNRLTGPDHDTSTYDPGNRLTEDTTHTYAYDANGNLVETRNTETGHVTTYTYDAEDGLIRVVTPKAEVTFQYDPLGRRTEKRVLRHEVEEGDRDADDEEEGERPRVIHYLYDQDSILTTFDDAGHEIARYTHGPRIDEPLAEARGHQLRFYHADVLGSIIALTDQHAHAIRQYQYSAFGDPEDHKGDSQPYRFTGREWNPEVKIYYYRARYYSPSIGRFVQQDPLGSHDGRQPDVFDMIDSTKPYLYVTNSPTNAADPFGLAQWHFDYSRTGERLIHFGKYRFNELGQLVEHTGRVIGEATGEALKALKYLMNVKPDFFRMPSPIIILDPCLIEPTLCRPCGPPA